MTRSLFGFICVLALGVMGCSETAGTGGSGGSAGEGGAGGGMPECQSPEDCDDDNECTDDTCLAGVCEFMPVPDPTGPDEPGDPPGEGTTCGYYMGTCEGGSCAGTFACTEAGIREAIAAGAGPHTFDCDGSTTVTTAAEIVIDNDVILDGEGNLTVDGDEDHRVFSVTGGVTVELEGFAVSGGDVKEAVSDDCTWPDCQGGGILNAGALTLTNSTVSGNTAWGGGGIKSNGALTLTNSTVSGNTAYRGGGIDVAGAAVTLTNSTVSDNSSSDCCGGIYIVSGTLTLTNSTVSGNNAATQGGGIASFNETDITLTNSTVSGNSASQAGGILSWNDDDRPPVGVATLTLTNCTVSGNSQEQGSDISRPSLAASSILTFTNNIIDGDCDTTVTSNGYNVESPGNTCGFDQTGDQVDVTTEQLNLGPLQDNGGPTETYALGAGSVAIDQIPAVDCEVATDQRGVTRPQGAMCDVGSFELE